jgi:AcrR family transcriptional regulator
MRRTKEEAAQTRAHILATALSLFSSQGYAGTSMDTIAKHAQLTKGALYWHFDSKAALYQALAEEYQHRALATLNAILTGGYPPLETIERYTVRTLELLTEDHHYAAMQRIWAVTEHSEELEDFANRRRAEAEETIRLLTHLFEEAQFWGDIRKNVDTYQAAMSLVAYRHGLMMLWFLHPELLHLERNAALWIRQWLQQWKEAPPPKPQQRVSALPRTL